jgi:hypothetical protein
MRKKITLSLFMVFLLTGFTRGDIQLNPKFKLSFSERFRFLSWDNAISLDDNAHAARSFTRHRTSLGGHWLPGEYLELTLKLTDEFRYYFIPEGTEFDLDEIFIDWLYIKWRHEKGALPGTLTFGRQNIILGEGFLVMDGHPLDGSRGIYFNAVRYDWDIKPDHRLTAFYSYMPSVDDWLPIIHDREQKLVEQDEEGFGFYYAGKYRKFDLQAYYLRKNVKEAGRFASVPSNIDALGGRLHLPLAPNLAYTVEGAYQFGKYGSLDRSAVGGYMYFTYQTGFKKLREYLPREITLGTIYLSGDSPGDDTWGGWDPMFARWPKWSESYIYTQIKEDAVAFWTNLTSLYGQLHFQFTDDVSFDFDYHHLMAPEKPPAGSTFPGGDGKTRGNLVINKLTYHFDKHWSGHILWEFFTPGDYYFDGADGYGWLRTEFMLKL